MEHHRTTARGGPRLRLLDPPEPPPQVGTPSGASIWAAPFRPGELPTIAWIPLRARTREMVDLGATSAGLPVELWVRIAVEAARIAGEIAALSDVEVAEVSAVLRDAAQQRDGGPPQLAAAGLRRYVGELSAGGRGTASAEELALRLPEEMAATWSRAAAEERIDLSRWLARRLEEAPVDCVGWEEAAAVQFRSLGEWAYASWLRSSASSNP